MSIEAGNEYVRNTIVKRHMKQEQIERRTNSAPGKGS
jgi:hypothetical protein